ncbi:STAS domain-containing protein [candidate division KSB1 bacterium]
MGIKEKITGNVAIVKVSGKLMGGPETDELHDKVKSLISDNINKIVIDLSKVKWMNSLGIGILMSCFTSSAVAGGGVILAGATEKVNSLLVITQLISLFEHYETVDEAITAFENK